MKQYTYFILVIVIMMAFYSCENKSKVYSQMERIDSLLHQERNDSAYKLIKTIKTHELKNEKDSAYYYFLLTWGRYVQYLPYMPKTYIDKSIEYYKKIRDKKKLAIAYTIKGGAAYEVGKVEEAVKSLKEGEKLAEYLNDTFIDYKLYGNLTVVNSKEDKYDLAIKYARKMLEVSRKSKNKEWICASLDQMAVCYYGLEQIDSARFYINQCIPHIDSITSKAKYFILNNIGFLNMEKDPQMALNYLRIAEKECPTVDTYDNLARIYARQGKEKKADSLWKKALAMGDIDQKITICEAELKHKTDCGRSEKETGPIKSQLLALKDSLAKYRKITNVEKQQYFFDHQTIQEKKNRSIDWLLSGIVLAGFILFASFILIIYTHKNENKLKANLIDKDSTIFKLQTTLDTQRKKSKKEPNFDLQKGYLLYESIINNGGTVQDWGKEDFNNFFAYYITVKNPMFKTVMEKYSLLSPKIRLYLVLREEWWKKERIAKCLNVSLVTLRSYKYRLKEKEITNDND